MLSSTSFFLHSPPLSPLLPGGRCIPFPDRGWSLYLGLFTHLSFLTSLLFPPVTFTGTCYSYYVLKWRYFPRFLPQNLLFSSMILQTLTYSISMFISLSIDTYIVTTYYVIYSARCFFCPLKNTIFFNPQIKSVSWILLFREQNRFRNIQPILRNHIVSHGTEKAKVLCMESLNISISPVTVYFLLKTHHFLFC